MKKSTPLWWEDCRFVCFETGLGKLILTLNDPNGFKNTANVYSIHFELRMALSCQISTGKWKHVNPFLDFLGISDQRTAYVKRQMRPGWTYVRRSSVTPDLIITHSRYWKMTGCSVAERTRSQSCFQLFRNCRRADYQGLKIWYLIVLKWILFIFLPFLSVQRSITTACVYGLNNVLHRQRSRDVITHPCLNVNDGLAKKRGQIIMFYVYWCVITYSYCYLSAVSTGFSQ